MATPDDILLTAGPVCRALRVTARQLDSWVRQGYLRPVFPAGGRGRHRLFRALDIMAIGVGISLRGRGVPLGFAGAIMKWIRDQDADRLEEDLAAGRSLLVQRLGGDIYSRLVAPGQLADMGIAWGEVTIVDLAAAWAIVEKLAAQSTEHVPAGR